MTALSPRDYAELALDCLHRIIDDTRRRPDDLHMAADYLRAAGLPNMASVVTEHASRTGGDDQGIRIVVDGLWAMLDNWPVTVESRRQAA